LSTIASSPRASEPARFRKRWNTSCYKTIPEWRRWCPLSVQLFRLCNFMLKKKTSRPRE
jgi:hypothetical protein